MRINRNLVFIGFIIGFFILGDLGKWIKFGQMLGFDIWIVLFVGIMEAIKVVIMLILALLIPDAINKFLDWLEKKWKV